MLLIIWTLVPFLASDCLSKEVREGTLPLLFLTPLHARDIVTSKALALGWRAFTLWLAVLPVLAIPFLQGGVDWREVVISAEVNFSSLLLALGAGLFASSLCRRWVRSLAVTMVTCLILVVWLMLTRMAVDWEFFSMVKGPTSANWPDFAESLVASISFLTDAGQLWSEALQSISPAERRAWLAGEAVSVGISVGVFLLLIGFVASRVRESWRPQSRSVRMERMERTFCRPVLWQSLLRRWMKRKLERNPVGWLGHRTWSGRLVIWSWFGIVVVTYSAALPAFGISDDFDSLQRLLAWLLLGSMAVSAAGSFQRERENGVLELMLVAPLGESSIIGGRLRGIWGQFLPAFVLLMGTWFYCRTMMRPNQFGWGSPVGWEPAEGSVLFFSAAYFTLPVVGLCFSLIRRTFFGALSSTLLFAAVLAPVIASAFRFYLNGFYLGIRIPGSPPMLTLDGLYFAALLEVGIGAWFYFRLTGLLRQRKFSFNRA
jgi:hypothetical protein